jgi:uncharacterized membrane protein YebE (DUF533 family)
VAQDNQFVQVIRVWAALAWADGEVIEAELRALERLIDRVGLTDREVERARSFLREPVELDTVGLASLDEPARCAIYRAALRLARVDHNIADAERAFLRRLRIGLGLEAAVVAAIEATIPAG